MDSQGKLLQNIPKDDKVIDKELLISGQTKIKDDDHVKKEGAMILERLSKVVHKNVSETIKSKLGL